MPTYTLKSFAQAIARFKTGLQAVANQAAIDISSAVLENLVKSTPVDTALARCNWLVGVGSAPGGVIVPYLPYKKFSGPKLSETANAAPTIAAGNAVLKTLGYVAPKRIHIVNNVGYVTLLNAGSSAQAPALFVESAIKIGILKGEHVFNPKIDRIVEISFLKGSYP